MIVLEHPTQDDIQAVFDLITRCDIDDNGEADVDFSDLEDDWSQLELFQDAWVIRTDHLINGYCALLREDDRLRLDLYSSKGQASKEIFKTLINKVIDRVQSMAVQEQRSIVLVTYFPTSNQMAEETLLESGFTDFTRHYRMRIDFSGLVAPVEWPESFIVESYDSYSEMELFSLISDSFNWEGFIQPSLEEWRRHVFRGGRFDPQYFLLLRRSGKLVGASLGYNEEPAGWIRQLAVERDLRGQGIGSLLLKHSFNVFQNSGQKSVELGVASTNQNAWQFYERCGMRRVREFIEFHREFPIG